MQLSSSACLSFLARYNLVRTSLLYIVGGEVCAISSPSQSGEVFSHLLISIVMRTHSNLKGKKSCDIYPSLN